jgi:hypothetical protein
MPRSAASKDKALQNARAYYEKLMNRKQASSGTKPKKSKHVPVPGAPSKRRSTAPKTGPHCHSPKKSQDEALQKGRAYYEQIMLKKSVDVVQAADRSELLSNTSVQSVPKVKVRLPIQPSSHRSTLLLRNNISIEKKSRSKSLIVIFVSALLLLGFLWKGDLRPRNDHVTIPSICFASSQPSPDESLSLQCYNKQSIFKDCPHGGPCAGGVLQSCDSVFFEKSANHDACVLTSFSTKKISTMVELLETWSNRFECHGSAPYFVQLHEPLKRPMFSGNRMTQELVLGFDWSLIEAANDVTPTFVTQKMENETLVGLHPLFPVASSGGCQAPSSMEPKTKPITKFSLLDNIQGKPWLSFRLPIVLAGSTILSCVPLVFPFLRGLFPKRATPEELDRLCHAALVRISAGRNKNGITNHSLLQSMIDGCPTAHQKQLVQDHWPQVMEFLKQDPRIRIQNVHRNGNHNKNSHAASEPFWKWVPSENPNDVAQSSTAVDDGTLHHDESVPHESFFNQGTNEWLFLEDGSSIDATCW